MNISKLLVFVIMFAVGAVMLAGAIRDKVLLGKPSLQLETMRDHDFEDGRMVEGTLYEMWNEYAEESQSDTLFGLRVNTKTTGHFFLFPLETSFEENSVVKLATISVSKDADFIKAQRMERESDAAYANDDWEKIVTTMQVKGRISKLSGKAKTYFEDCIRQSGYEPAANGVYYVITQGDTGNKATAALVASLVVMSGGAIGGVIAFLRGRRRY